MQYTNTIIAFPADTHCGSPVGLMPLGQWAFTNGGYHNPDTAQQVIARLWEAAWTRLGRERQGKRLIVVHVGDAVEGKHHDSTEIITPRIDEQERIHLAVMEQALGLAGFDPVKGDRLYYVKGTPAHVGPGGASEERIARNFDNQGIVPYIQPVQDNRQDGRFLWDHLLLEVNSKLLDIAHHGASVGNKPWTRTNQLRGKLQEIYFRAIEAKQRPPDVWLRADRHEKAYDVYVSRTGLVMHGFVTPAFQGKTEYSNRVALDKPANLGMVWIEIARDGAITPSWEGIELTDEVTVL